MNFIICHTKPPIYWAHEGKMPSINALTISSLFDLNYIITSKITMGLELMHQKANFKYDTRTRTIPRESNIGEIHDTVKLAALNLGFRGGYQF